jgi:hypothetical protein
MKLPGIEKGEVSEAKIVKYLLSTSHRAGKVRLHFSLDLVLRPRDGKTRERFEATRFQE